MTNYYFRPVDGFDQSILTLEDMLYYGEDMSSKLETNLTEHLVKRIYLGVKMLQGYNIEVIEDVIDSLQNNTDLFLPVYIEDRIHYVVWCHGADSHEHDQLGYQCSTEYWVACATLFWRWVREMDELLDRPLPVACALFGGYRDDDYNSVLSLHTADFVECFKELLSIDVKYNIEVRPRQKFDQYNASKRL
jgi:acetoin utilization deacetylase AcuC-like enzyme